MMISIHKEGYTHKIVTKKRTRYPKEAINVLIRYLLESIAHG